MAYLSPEKRDELTLELSELKGTRLPDLAKRIDDARQLGDLSENAEYHAAREDMAWAQTRVKEIEYILENSEVVTNTAKAGNVGVGSVIQVTVGNKERTFTIVGAQEADPMNGKISNESPLGSAFLGRKKGDSVEVAVPAGTQKYTITHIA